MIKCQYPIGVFGGVFGNIPTLEKIIKIFQENKVKTTVFLGDLLAVGNPKEAIELSNKHIDHFLTGNSEKFCIMKEDPLRTLYPWALWCGILKTREILKEENLPDWFKNEKTEIKCDKFYFTSNPEKFINPNDLVNFEYIFFRSESSMEYKTSKSKKIFYIPEFCPSIYSQIVILNKRYFDVFSIPFDFEYALDWSRSNINDERTIKSFESTTNIINTSTDKKKLNVKRERFYYNKNIKIHIDTSQLLLQTEIL